ncbi:MAG: hemerythrin domain-containing protein [Magnetococcales bacterium]|nr:hemerythrin domain-containing protein [Magnetococcales bacterium]
MNDTPLNLTGTDTAAKEETLLQAFAGLAPGGALQALCDSDPQPLLATLQATYWGGFDWHPLENGPEQWRVLLRRLPGSGGTRGLKEFMTTDHQQCDALYAEAENAAQAGELNEARQRFLSFDTSMQHHFRMEEEGFFPAFEQATGMTQGPTTVMRMEHRQMLGVIAQMRQAMGQNDLPAWVRAGSTLMVLMRQHNIKEEQMLYPMGEMHLEGVDPLLKAMQRL